MRSRHLFEAPDGTKCVVIACTVGRDAIISNTCFCYSPCSNWISVIVESYDCVMTQPYDLEGLPSPSSALLQLARLKAGMSQRELAERAGVPVTMISAYERDQRQPTLSTLLRLLRAAGFDLRLHLAAYDPHDDILAEMEAGRTESERLRRDRQLQAWRQATPAEDVA